MKRETDIDYKLFCCVCKSDEKGKPLVSVAKTFVGDIFVHEECLKRYEKVLCDPEEHKSGRILGACAFCGKPVRSEQEFTLSRASRDGTPMTTFPSIEELIFVHDGCDEDCLMNTKYPLLHE